MPTANADLTIREATPHDLPIILRMIQGLAEYERLAEQCQATEEKLRRTLFGEPRYAESVIASLGAEAVGFALFFHNYSTFAASPGLYLEDLFVLPEHRGLGVGRALLRHLARLAVSRDCARFEWAVLDWNEPAIGFYKSLGARPLHDWTVFRVTGEALQQLAR
jgi:GNAT superfamily N-acetyltransferase